MSPDRWLQIEEVFAGTEGLPAAELRAYLDQRCGNDAGLRREVEALLAHQPKPGDKLLEGVVEKAAEFLAESRSTLHRELAERRLGMRIGPYHLVRVLGTGGMGIVYLGIREDEYQKKAAIKLIQSGLDSKHVLDRFRQERRILAQLDHPYIARFLDGGLTAEGQPYYVMEYVEEGLAITDYCRARKLPLIERVKLFLQVSSAVNHAHRNLVVHRDLKPTNILVGSDETPKLLDFGIAKVLDQDAANSSRTQTVLRMLTPDYASPEQVLGLPITTATDVYQLGAILYELLCGKPAHRFRNYSSAEIERVICLQDPAPPSQAAVDDGRSAETLRLSRSLESDLDSIVAMAMRKEPAQRYQSVEQLSDDLERYLKGEPVEAHRGTMRYRASKFLRRNRLPLAAAAAVAVTLIGGVTATIYQAQRAERRFQQVRSLTNTLLNEFDQRVASLPQSTELREWMSSTVVQYLDNLAKEAGNDTSLQADLAAGYLKVAQLQASQFGAHVGQNLRALENYRKSAGIYARLSEAAPDDAATLSGYCQALRQLGHAEGFAGNLQASRANFEKAVERGKRLEVLSPDRGNECLTGAYAGMVGVQIRTSNAQGAIPYLAQELEHGRRLDEAKPSRETKEQLLSTYLNMASAQMESGNPNAGLQALRQAEAVGRRMMSAAEWATSRFRFRYLDTAGDLYGNPRDVHLMQSEQSLAAFREALSIAEKEYARDLNDARARRDLDRILRKTALMVVDRTPQEAIDLCQRALKLSELHLRNAPNNPEYARDHADGLLITGYGLQNLGRHPEALSYLDRGLQRQLDVERYSPEAKRFQRELQETYEALGDTYLAMGRHKDALQQYEKGRERTVALLWERPTDAYLLRDLADSNEKLAGMHAVLARLGGSAEREHWRQAIDFQQKSLDTWIEWPRRIAPGDFARMREERARKMIDSYKKQAAKPL